MATERTIRLINNLGLHVRPAAKIAETAGKYKSTITISKDNHLVNAKSIIELLTLAAPFGASLTVRADGEDAEAAVGAIQQVIDAKFGEE